MVDGDVLEVLVERGFVKDISDKTGLRRALERPIAVYCGYDATATSYHVGNTVTMMMLSWLQRYGHTPIALMGGGTTMVGDPSGKSRERPLLTQADIAANVENLRPQVAPFLDFNNGALMLDNSAWLSPLNLIEFLRDVGAKFTVNHMLSHETYRVRLEQGGLSFLEFSYQLLQAYDYLHLYREYGCLLQIGGSDQWANILAGTDLIRRTERVQAFALVCDLITTSGGAKMGKSEAGAVWLDSAMLSAYDFYQFWINTEDADVKRFLGLFTFLPMEDVHRFGSLRDADIREAKEILALEVTKIVHGEQAAREAQLTARALFSGQGATSSAPTAQISRSRFDDGVGIIDLAVEAGLLPSKREARRVLEQGGLSINGRAVGAIDHVVSHADLDEDGNLILRAGKKRYLRVHAT